MINLSNPKHRQRLAKAVETSFQAHKTFNAMRHSTIRAYLGVVPRSGTWDWMYDTESYKKRLPKGNLLQLAALNLQVALAYGEPQFIVRARTPEYQGFALELSAALNRMVTLLNLGEIVRSVAADSFFGYGIFKCGLGVLPLSAQHATGQNWGPCAWRVSQNNWIYDTSADVWDQVGFVGDIYSMGLEEARNAFPGKEDRLQPQTDGGRTGLRHLLPRPSRFSTAEEKVWLADFYIPSSQAIGIWPINNEYFSDLDNEPLSEIPYTGHWSGLYQHVGHVYTPDEIIPVAQAESTKSLHFLFQDVFGKVADQALNAKINPLYRQGSDREMRRVWGTEDRYPVGVNVPGDFNSAQMGYFEVPGPSQSQSNFLGALVQFFNMFTPHADQPNQAPTARQGELKRETTDAFTAEARRKLHRALQLVGYKLATLLKNDQNLVLPSAEPLAPGAPVMVDRTWRPGPRPARIDDFDISIDPYALPLRTPEQKLAVMLAMMDRTTTLLAQRAAGAPINIEAALRIMAEYSGTPELRELYEELDPLLLAQKSSQSLPSPQRPGAGHYVRENVSEKTNEGALTENLQNMTDSSQQPTRFQ